MIARLLLTLLAAACATTVSAQYEELIAAPEADPDYVAPVVELPPVPRLLPPTLHRARITQLEQSPDHLHLLTADAQVLRIWDVNHRASFAALAARRDQPIDFAAFTTTPQQVLVLSGDRLRLYDDFNFDEPAYESWVGTQTNYAFHRDTGTFLSASANNERRTFEFSVFNLGTRQRQPLAKIDLGPDYTTFPVLYVHPGNNLSIDASGRYAAFRFADKQPLAVFDLTAKRLVATVPADRSPVGLLPTAEVLLHSFDGTTHQLDALDPATGSSRRLTTINDRTRLVATLPAQTGDPLRVGNTDVAYLHDLAAATTSVAIRFPGRTTDAAIAFHDGTHTRPLVAQSTRNANGAASATFLEPIDPALGVARGTWAPPTFAANAVFTRGDDFEFIARRDTDLRRVRFTESALQIDPLITPAALHYPASITFNRQTAAWDLIDSSSPLLATPTGPDGTYVATTVGQTREGNVSFSSTHASERSRDGRYLALHHGRAVQVIDTATGQAVGVFTHPPADLIVNTDRRPGLAFAPDGTALAFSYVVGHSFVTECRAIPSGELKWTSTAIHRDFKYSSDGSRIYGRPVSASGALGVVYADTGELATTIRPNTLGPERIVYNAGGTLAAFASGSSTGSGAIELYTLPEGRAISRLELPFIPTSLGFIGSDRFLLTTSGTDEIIRLLDTQAQETVAELYLFESPQKWLVRHPATNLFSSETSLQNDLQFAVGQQITPLASYFDEFYRPRLLGSLIKGLAPRPSVPVTDLRYAPKLALSVDGPSTRGLSVEDEFESLEIPTPEVTLKLDASCEGSPIADLRIYHNGKLVAGATRGLSVEDDEDAPPAETFTKTARHTFTLTPGKNRFRAVALNAQGTESVPDELIVYSDATPPEDETAGIALHVVTVGLDAYQNPSYNLNYAVADARAVEHLLRDRLGRLFTRAHHYALYDAQATRENILATLETVKREAGPRDVFVFYYAGHGVMSEGDEDPEFYLAPHEITQLYGERRILRQLGIPGRDLLAYSRDIAAQKQLWILDACQSAGALKNVAVRGAVEERAIAQLARSTGTHWLTSTGSEQFATEFAALGHGAFTSVLLDGLRGAADGGDGIVSVNELKAYVEAKVPEVTAAAKGEAQYPVTYGYGQDFPLTLVP